MRSTRLLLVAFLSIATITSSRAQETSSTAQNYDFKAGSTVIFADDFKGASQGEFPPKWEQQHGQAVVATLGGEPAMSLIADGTQVKPRMTTDHYLPASFTLEFDIFPKKDTTALFLLFNDGGDADAKIQFNTGDFTFVKDGSEVASYKIPEAQADENFVEKWHHVALTYSGTQMKVYLDQARAFTVPDTHFSPYNFVFSGDGQAGIPINFSNVRLASGGNMNMVGKQFTDAKIVTHAINFAVNSATITADSAGEIGRIAGILRDNPTLRFESAATPTTPARRAQSDFFLCSALKPSRPAPVTAASNQVALPQKDMATPFRFPRTKPKMARPKQARGFLLASTSVSSVTSWRLHSRPIGA